MNCRTADVCMERRVSSDEDDAAGNDTEGERVKESEVAGGVPEGQVCLKLDIRGGGLGGEWERWEASLAGGGGEGNMLSVRASRSAFSIGEGGRDEVGDKEWEREWEGKRSSGTVRGGSEEV